MRLQGDAKEILDAVKAGDFLLKLHGGERSLQREIPVEEIQYIAETAFKHDWQEEKQTHLFLGKRSNGKGGGFSAKKESSGVWVVTVFKRTLKKEEKKETKR